MPGLAIYLPCIHPVPTIAHHQTSLMEMLGNTIQVRPAAMLKVLNTCIDFHGLSGNNCTDIGTDVQKQ